MKIKQTLEIIEKFEISHAERPTIAKLGQLLYDKAVGTSLHVDMPVAVLADYVLATRVVHRSNATGLAYHLHAPSAGAVAAITCDALTRSGCLSPGQIVFTNATKYIDNKDLNVLIVSIVKLDTICTTETKSAKHKFLEWYLEKCQTKNLSPTWDGYAQLLKHLSKKQGKKSNPDYTSEALKDQVPDFFKK